MNLGYSTDTYYEQYLILTIHFKYKCFKIIMSYKYLN